MIDEELLIHTLNCWVLCRGYIAPEYALNGQVSVKSDVFSFGLLMLEVISGRRIYEESLPPDQQYLLHWVSLKQSWKLCIKKKYVTDHSWNTN